jgi:hypothetical protein
MRSRLDYFLLMYLYEAETSWQLRDKGKNTTTVGKLLKFFGVWILMTRYEFTERRGLWSTSVQHKYLSVP